ncbi:hypothetical protein CSKR_111399 [Clonorchis sinensis]|uniref:Tetraspanin n=1 Tax=Clonorchis sinensis TaxID=79923 RepID=A0A8T1LYJ3_CLOSI|nr:hypothetical protein CSKR_111399 [Clonorchis sinensis]
MCGFGSKILLSILNSIVIILGLILVIVGAIVAWGTHLIVKLFDGPAKNFIETLGQDKTNIVKLAIREIGPIARPIGLLLFFLGLIIIGIAIFGCVGATCNKKLCLKIYVIILSVIVLCHILLLIIHFSRPTLIMSPIKSELERYVKQYKSIQSGEAASVFLSMLMTSLECCGVNGWEDFKQAKEMSKTDKFFGFEAKDLQFPLMCCKTDASFTLTDPQNCIKNPDDQNSNIKKGCAKALEKFMVSMFNKILYGSLILLAVNIVLILLTVLALV